MKATEGLFVGASSVSALRCRNARPAEMFCLRLHSIICSYARVRAMLMEIANVNTGLNAQKVDPRADSAKLLWRSVGLHLCISIRLLFFLPVSLFHSDLGQRLCSHSISINPVCWGSSPAPPRFFLPSPPPHPVSQLILVSVMDHIWEGLSCSGSVC